MRMSVSQAGYLLKMMMQSLAENGGYDEADFCRRLETELFPQLDGTPMAGPGGYTSQSIRETWRRRVQQKLPWSQTGGQADTTEAIERTMAAAVADLDIRIEPAWKVSIVYGMPCAIYHQLPAAYYLAARFADDYESAVFHAVNGGGQNQARAILTGALVGAQVGIEGIPKRLRDGLDDVQTLSELAGRIAELI